MRVKGGGKGKVGGSREGRGGGAAWGREWEGGGEGKR
jgi:hypothetical protein